METGIVRATSMVGSWNLLLFSKNARSGVRGEGAMDNLRRTETEEEPVGIIISRGSRAEETPRFSAYVWGPVPTGETEESSGKLAVA
jgi:hypothetical protein